MNNVDVSCLRIAFLASFFIVGAPFWLIPYNKVNLPNALYGAGLVVVAIAAMWLRSYGIAPFWRVVRIMTASVPTSVFAGGFP